MYHSGSAIMILLQQTKLLKVCCEIYKTSCNPLCDIYMIKYKRKLQQKILKIDFKRFLMMLSMSAFPKVKYPEIIKNIGTAQRRTGSMYGSIKGGCGVCMKITSTAQMNFSMSIELFLINIVWIS